MCAAGGYNHADGHLRSVEFLDPRVGRWERGEEGGCGGGGGKGGERGERGGGGAV